jgi:hypothetical protein
MAESSAESAGGVVGGGAGCTVGMRLRWEAQRWSRSGSAFLISSRPGENLSSVLGALLSAARGWPVPSQCLEAR